MLVFFNFALSPFYNISEWTKNTSKNLFRVSLFSAAFFVVVNKKSVSVNLSETEKIVDWESNFLFKKTSPTSPFQQFNSGDFGNGGGEEPKDPKKDDHSTLHPNRLCVSRGDCHKRKELEDALRASVKEHQDKINAERNLVELEYLKTSFSTVCLKAAVAGAFAKMGADLYHKVRKKIFL